jgi:hypothetical protein
MWQACQPKATAAFTHPHKRYLQIFPVFISKTKTHIYHAIVKSTITYAAETGCLKAKTTAKLNSTEMEFGDVQREFLGRTKLETLLLNKK